jgi:hypothetical protein
MFQALALVLGNAAPPQKIALILLFGAIPFTLLAAALAFRKDVQGSKWRRVVEDLRFVGPALGLLLGALNSFHMGQTIQRLPLTPPPSSWLQVFWKSRRSFGLEHSSGWSPSRHTAC